MKFSPHNIRIKVLLENPTSSILGLCRICFWKLGSSRMWGNIETRWGRRSRRQRVCGREDKEEWDHWRESRDRRFFTDEICKGTSSFAVLLRDTVALEFPVITSGPLQCPHSVPDRILCQLSGFSYVCLGYGKCQASVNIWACECCAR